MGQVTFPGIWSSGGVPNSGIAGYIDKSPITIGSGRVAEVFHNTMVLVGALRKCQQISYPLTVCSAGTVTYRQNSNESNPVRYSFYAPVLLGVPD